jgi:hypothetical protein
MTGRWDMVLAMWRRALAWRKKQGWRKPPNPTLRVFPAVGACKPRLHYPAEDHGRCNKCPPLRDMWMVLLVHLLWFWSFVEREVDRSILKDLRVEGGKDAQTPHCKAKEILAWRVMACEAFDPTVSTGHVYEISREPNLSPRLVVSLLPILYFYFHQAWKVSLLDLASWTVPS